MSKTVEISAAFSTISSRLDSFGCWPYQCWPPKQLAAHGFYKMPGKEGDPIACFSCRKEWHYMCREIMTQPSSIITRLMSHSIVAQPPQQEPGIDSSPSPHRSSPLPSPLPTANTASCETAGDLSSSTSTDNLHTRSDNTPPSQHPQSTSRKPISDQDISVATAPHFVSEFSISGVPPHSRFLLSVEGGHISAKIRCELLRQQCS